MKQLSFLVVSALLVLSACGEKEVSSVTKKDGTEITVTQDSDNNKTTTIKSPDGSEIKVTDSAEAQQKRKERAEKRRIADCRALSEKVRQKAPNCKDVKDE